VVGYVGRINREELERNDEGAYRGMTHIGKTGIERQYEELLRGRAGVEQVEINAQGRVLRTLRRDAPRPGHSLYLNLDSALQSVAEAAFAKKAGALVAIEPATGAVLALVSVPSFDPNLFVHGIDFRQYRELSRSPKRPLFNRALSGRYPPGSTVKPFIGFAGIEQRMDLANGNTWCRGYYQLKGYTRQYRDWKRTGHGEVGLTDAIEQSCDVYFYELAQALGIDRIYDAMTQFGFGLPTGIDIPGEASGLMPSRSWKRKARGQPWYPGETLITGIGQGFMLATPLQLANATAVLGSRGRRVRPRVLGNVVDPASGDQRALPSVALTPVIGRVAGAWDRIIDAMVKVVHGRFGTARRIGVDAPAKIAGKTGTAQVFSRKEGTDLPKEQQEELLKDHALFVAFAPVRNPQIAVALVVEHGGSGSSAAAPIARKVLDAYLGAMPERRQDLFAKHPDEPQRVTSQQRAVSNGA
jgi:penicillin-binding protein 2